VDILHTGTLKKERKKIDFNSSQKSVISIL